MRMVCRRLRYIVRQRRMQADLAEEMAFHREMNAMAGATSTFGSTAMAADDSHDVWVWPWLRDIWQDVRFAARLLIKDPRLTLTAVLALALGISVNNTIFTIVNTAVLRERPFDEPDRLVSIGTWDARGRESGVSYQDFTDWRAMTRTFTGLAAYTGRAVNLSGDENAPERVQGAYLSAGTLRLLRIEPALGRDFTADDDRVGAPPVALIGDRLWHRRYGSDRSILGRTVLINDTPSTVLGVTPPDFRFPFSDEIWQPLALAPGISSAKRDVRSLNVLGRLADSQSIDGARADLEVIAARLAIAHPDTNKAIRSRIAPMGPPKPPTAILMALTGSVIFVLLIACANVANLLLARSAGRTKELAIRASLGATRWRIVRQLPIECGILAVLVGAPGLALSVYGVKCLVAAFNGRQTGAPASAAVTPYWVDLSMNEPVFLFLGSVCLVSGAHIRLTNQSAADPPSVWLTIVGVAPTIPQSIGSPDQDRAAVFVPLLGQTTPGVVSLLIRSQSDVAGAVSFARDEVRAIDPSLPVYWVQSMEQMFADARAPLRLIGGWFGALAVIALVLATIGLYAVTGHLVVQRTQEIGVRVALGAEKHQVVWLFVRRTIRQLSVGVAIGMAGALAVGQVLQTVIAGVSPRDPLTLVLVTLLLTGAAIAATLLPARRAMRIEPLVALRNEERPPTLRSALRTENNFSCSPALLLSCSIGRNAA